MHGQQRLFARQITADSKEKGGKKASELFKNDLFSLKSAVSASKFSSGLRFPFVKEKEFFAFFFNLKWLIYNWLKMQTLPVYSSRTDSGKVCERIYEFLSFHLFEVFHSQFEESFAIVVIAVFLELVDALSHEFFLVWVQILAPALA